MLTLFYVAFVRSFQIKENEVGGACGTHGRGEKRVQSIGGKSPREREHLKDQGVDGRMGSNWTLERLVGGCEMDSPSSG
jgi:hypothetical protein